MSWQSIQRCRLDRLTVAAAVALLQLLALQDVAAQPPWCRPVVAPPPWCPPPVASGPYGWSEAVPPAVVNGGPLLQQPTIALQPVSQDCNLAVEVTEEFANRVLSRCDTQQGPVRDFVLGADVFGEQSTSTRTWFDFRSSPGSALIELRVSGEIDTQTVGVTPQAEVQSLGHHQMELSKEIEFDGVQFRTRSPSAWVTPSQQNIAAMTRVGRYPIIGPIANSVAMQAAEARKPQAAAITAERITRQAAPPFNERVDAELGRLNRLLSETVRPQVETLQLLPTSQGLRSTDSAIQWRMAVGPEPYPRTTPLDDPRIPHGRAGGAYLHESLVNGLISRLPLRGLAVPDAAIDRWFQTLASGAGLAALATPGEPIAPRLVTIQFDRDRPLRLHLHENRAELIVRVGLTPVAGPSIPVQELTIPFTVQLTANSLEFLPEEVTIIPGDPSASGGMIDEAARRLIRETVQARLERRSLPRQIPLRIPDHASADLQLRDVRLHDGWLSVVFD